MNFKRFHTMLILFLLVLSLLTAGCRINSNAGQTNPAMAGIMVKNGKLQNQAAVNGKLEAVQTAGVVSKVTGKVREVKVDVGVNVKKGQVLMNLEADDLQANIEVARSAVDSAQVAYDLAVKNYERGQALLASGALSQASFDDNYEGTYRKTEAALKSARANLEKARIAYEDTFLKAPFSGVITARNINPGEIVFPQAPVISMVNLDQVLVKLGVNESQINQLKTGQTTEVTVAAASPQAFTGTITAISPAADPQTKAYTIKIQVDNPQHILKPGMFAEVKIEGESEKGLLLPKTAFINEAGEISVLVAENGKAEKRKVVAGGSDQQNTIVLSGLRAGETVIVAPHAGLRDGQPVQLRVNNSSN